MEYDVLDRPVRKQWQNGTSQSFSYGIAPDVDGIPRLLRTFIDEKGRATREYTSPQGWITTSIAPDSAVTSFRYDAWGQLLSSTDPDGLTTTHLYDALGRHIRRTHPDAGTTRWTYDPVGHVIASADQQQSNQNRQTEYHYDYDRLMTIHQTLNNELDVSFVYDSVGHIAQRTDVTGIEEFTYDPMGNIIQSDRLIAIPTEHNAYRFSTRYLYDVFGRMVRIVFPDNKFINYYYSNGQLTSIGYIKHAPHHLNGQQSPPHPPVLVSYLRNCQYDAYERPIHYQLENYATDFSYDSNRLWMVHKTTYAIDNSRTLQDLDYTYDAVGNITAIEQNADSVHWLGGPYIQEFQYDSQDRLTRADMLSDYWGLYSDYNLTYSPSGRIGIKSCDDMLWTFWHGYCGVNNSIINHQVRSIYDMDNDASTFFMWDAAGRMQDIYRPCSGNLRHHWWNESGQLAAMVDNGHCAFYGYDGNGERVYKLTGTTALDQYNAGQETFHMYLNNAVIYVNPYFTITPRNYTRHVFNGSQRLATDIGKKNLSSCIDTTALGAERLANARAYMQSLFSENISLQPDTASTFVDIEGYAYDELQWQCTDDSLSWDITVQCDSDMFLPILMRENGAADTRVAGTYNYHTDHLGSAHWITKGDDAVQFIHYMPYGEMWYNQQGSAYDERFKYTGKERDSETDTIISVHGAICPMVLCGYPLILSWISIHISRPMLIATGIL